MGRFSNLHWCTFNVTKTKHSFFHKTSKKDEIPPKLPRLQINYYSIEIIRNILNNLIFTHKVRNETVPAVFLSKF